MLIEVLFISYLFPSLIVAFPVVPFNTAALQECTHKCMAQEKHRGSDTKRYHNMCALDCAKKIDQDLIPVQDNPSKCKRIKDSNPEVIPKNVVKREAFEEHDEMVKLVACILQNSDAERAAFPIEDHLIPNRFEYAVENQEPFRDISLKPFRANNNVPENIWSALYALRKANRELMMARNSRRSVLNELDKIAMNLKNENSKRTYETTSEPSMEVKGYSQDKKSNNLDFSHQNENLISYDTSESFKNNINMRKKAETSFNMDNTAEYWQAIRNNRLPIEDINDEVIDEKSEITTRVYSDSTEGSVVEYPNLEWTNNIQSEKTESQEVLSYDVATGNTEKPITEETLSKRLFASTEKESTKENESQLIQSNPRIKFSWERKNMLESTGANNYVPDIKSENRETEEDSFYGNYDSDATESSDSSFSEIENVKSETENEINPATDTHFRIEKTEPGFIEDYSKSLGDSTRNIIYLKSEESMVNQDIEATGSHETVESVRGLNIYDDSDKESESIHKDRNSVTTDSSITKKPLSFFNESDEAQEDLSNEIYDHVTPDPINESVDQMKEPLQGTFENTYNEKNPVDNDYDEQDTSTTTLLENVTLKDHLNQEKNDVVKLIAEEYQLNEDSAHSFETNHSAEEIGSQDQSEDSSTATISISNELSNIVNVYSPKIIENEKGSYNDASTDLSSSSKRLQKTSHDFGSRVIKRLNTVDNSISLLRKNESDTKDIKINNEEEDSTTIENSNDSSIGILSNNSELDFFDDNKSKDEKDVSYAINNIESESSDISNDKKPNEMQVSSSKEKVEITDNVNRRYTNNIEPDVTDDTDSDGEQDKNEKDNNSATDIENNDVSDTGNIESETANLENTNEEKNMNHKETFDEPNSIESESYKITSNKNPLINDDIKEEQDTAQLQNSDKSGTSEKYHRTASIRNKAVFPFKNKFLLNSVFIPDPVTEEIEEESSEKFFSEHATPVDSIFVGDESNNFNDGWKYEDPKVTEYVV